MSPTNTDHIHVGKDGWLFVVAGSNNVIGQFNSSSYMAFQLETWRKILIQRRFKFRKLGVLYRHIVVPEKLSIYDDKLDGIEIDIALSPAHRLTRTFPRMPKRWHAVGGPIDALRLRRTCVDLIKPMRAARLREDLYHRTDSHWSFAGRCIAYQAICQACGALAQSDMAERPFTVADYAGDLGSVFNPKRTETARFYNVQRDAVRVYASPIVEARERANLLHTLHVGAHVIYSNANAGDPRRVVLFGDSYAHFSTHMLTIMLAETFREVHFVWSTSLDWGYIHDIKPDVVMTEIAERFMFRTPDDTFDIRQYAAERFNQEL